MGTRSFFGRHYALAVTAIIFAALLAAAGLRSTPGVLMVPWETAFGWSRSTISFAAATGIFLFGFTGPFAAAAMQRFGIRTTVMTALAMMIGMLPMALALGEGAEQNAPLGRAVIGGLLAATFATLFFVPTVFSLAHRHARKAKQDDTGLQPALA